MAVIGAAWVRWQMDGGCAPSRSAAAPGSPSLTGLPWKGSTWSLLLPGLGALPIQSPRNFPLWKSSGTMEATPPRWTAGPILTELPAEKTKQKPVPPSQPLRSPALRHRRFRRMGTGLFLQGRWTATAIRRWSTSRAARTPTHPGPTPPRPSGSSFSIDPEETYWPSDASMPVGQPSTRDVHILN